jgi:polyisoprenoid-binding protein YceI
MSTTTTSATQTSLPVGSWEIDPIHSSLGFEVKHLGISTFRGRFTGFEGTIETGDEGLVRVEGTIDPASIDVQDEKLAGHLASEDFFDVEHYPRARFVSTSTERSGDGYRLVGNLTLRDRTRPVELDVSVEGVGVDPVGNDRISLSATGEIDRTDFGMDWNGTLENGAPMAGEKVRLVLTAEAFRREH